MKQIDFLNKKYLISNLNKKQKTYDIPKYNMIRPKILKKK